MAKVQDSPSSVSSAHPEPQAGAGVEPVKRDMELIRRIMLAVQEKDDLDPRPITLEDVDPIVLGRHVEMLGEAGVLSGFPTDIIGEKCSTWYVTDLSWEGHEFIGAIGNDEWWNGLKKAVAPSVLATASLKMIKDAAIAWGTSYLKQKMGIP